MTPKNHILKFVIEPSVFPYPVAFWLGKHDGPAMQKWVHSRGLGNGDMFEVHENEIAACWDMHGSSLIWLNKEPDKITEAAALIHESAHATFNAGRYLGFVHSQKSEEFYTYFIQYLSTVALLKISQHRKNSH